MSYNGKDSNANPCEGILVIVNEIERSLNDFIEVLPKNVDYQYFESKTRNALNRIRNYFN